MTRDVTWLTPKTPTRLRVPVAQMSDSNGNEVSTITTALPIGHAARHGWKAPKGSQSPKSMSGQIQCGWVRAVAIQALLIPRSPAAISGFVVSIIVDAIEAVFGRWALSHVGQELLKGIQPLIAHPNSPTAVAVVPGVRRVCAAVFGRPPCFVLRPNWHSTDITTHPFHMERSR